MGNISLMEWNWQQPDWPNFRYNKVSLAGAEAEFLRQGGELMGAFRHLLPSDEQELSAEILTSEAMNTSAIEGEILDRESVRSSILNQLGASMDARRVPPRERGIAELTVSVIRTAMDPLGDELLCNWHRMLMQGNTILLVGAYRTREDAMRIVSGPIGRERVHFEAPPSAQVQHEMAGFIDWFNDSRPATPALARAGIAHLYFESIHPFEDGNGRIGRAIVEKALAQALGRAGLTMLATEIEARRSAYYSALENGNQSIEITDWVMWFAEAILAAQRRTRVWIEFLIAKTRLLDRLRGRIHERQEAALLRMFREGPSGFVGGLSAGNYQTITGASPATAGRDLSELVDLGALTRTGSGKGTRYWLAVSND